MLQKVVITAMPDMMAVAGTKYLDRFTGGLTPEQRNAISINLAGFQAWLRCRERQHAASAENNLANGPIAVSIRDVVGANKRNPMIAFYAAGIGVMFLLFAASGPGR
ncbi:MAG TPA: hypothetical protein VMF67_11235 [Rhizomicrobium sp.]|nr:hypothetical protein [Rhizomicrobium sp.]